MQTTFRVVLVTALAGLLIGFTPILAGAADALDIKTPQVEPGGDVIITGVGLKAFEGQYKLYLDDEPVHENNRRVWTDTSIQFEIQSQPGIHRVYLVPIYDLPELNLGDVEVLKENQPEARAKIVPGHILVRWAPRLIQPLYATDICTPMYMPEDNPSELMSRWSRCLVPVGLEQSRIHAYTELPNVEVAEADGIVQPGQKPNDPCRRTRPGLTSRRRIAAWGIVPMGRSSRARRASTTASGWVSGACSCRSKY